MFHPGRKEQAEPKKHAGKMLKQVQHDRETGQSKCCHTKIAALLVEKE